MNVEATTSEAPRVFENSVYTLVTARETLGLKKNCLPREIRNGRLRASKRAGQYFILGKWILEWIETGERRRQQAAQEIE